MRKIYALLAVLLIGGTQLMAQRNCGTMQYLEQQKQNDPSTEKSLLKQEDQIKNWVKENGDRFRTSGGVITIPVVVHVVYRTTSQNISNAQIQSQIDVLNEDYRALNTDFSSVPAGFQGVAADAQIEFCLAVRDPQGNPTTGITRTSTTVNSFSTNDNVKYASSGGVDAWPRGDYLNLWVCNLGGGLLGYSQFPGTGLAATDGVVCGYNFFGRVGTLSAPYNKGRTLTHEVGHWLNLRHIWGDDGGSCSGTDQVADTPNQGGENYGCPSFPQVDNCTSTSPGVMFMNYMDYTDDACMFMFTAGQASRMAATLNGFRSSLQNSMGCVPLQLAGNDAGISAISSPSGTLCSELITPSFTLKNFGTNTLTSVTLNWQIDGGAVSTQAWTGSLASQATTTVTLAQQGVTPGAHTINIYTTNPNGNTDGDTQNDASTSSFNVATSGQIPPFTYDFSSSTWPPAGWTLDNPDGSYTWEHKATTGFNGNGCVWIDNYTYQDRGQRDAFQIPAVNLSGVASADLTFDLSYVLYSQSGYSDTLYVDISTDCGATWTNVYTKHDQALTTVTPYYLASAFTPSSPSQWRNESISLNQFAGAASVIARFTNGNDYENNLYIDNINIAVGTVGVDETVLNQAVTVFPNPSNGVFKVGINMPTASDLNLSVYSIHGQQVIAKSLVGFTSGNLDFDMSTVSAGVYFLRVEAEGTTIVKKIAIR